MQVQRTEAVSITTASDGTATGYIGTGAPITGRVHAIVYAKDGTTPYDNTVDATVTAEATGEPIVVWSNLSASGRVYPRVPMQDEVGADATLDGTRKVREAVLIANDRIKVVLAQGGSTKIGSFYAIIGG